MPRGPIPPLPVFHPSLEGMGFPPPYWKRSSSPPPSPPIDRWQRRNSSHLLLIKLSFISPPPFFSLFQRAFCNLFRSPNFLSLFRVQGFFPPLAFLSSATLFASGGVFLPFWVFFPVFFAWPLFPPLFYANETNRHSDPLEDLLFVFYFRAVCILILASVPKWDAPPGFFPPLNRTILPASPPSFVQVPRLHFEDFFFILDVSWCPSSPSM